MIASRFGRLLGALSFPCAIAAAAAPASAAQFIFSGGTFVPGVTAPAKLLSGDSLEIVAGAAKTFSGRFMNISGQVNWNADNLSFASGAEIDNDSVWDAKSDGKMVPLSGSPSPLFFNSGTFRKSGGTGVTEVDGLFVNDGGVIDAQTGTIRFVPAVTRPIFTDSYFSGAGSVVIDGSAGFRGIVWSTNLTLKSGTLEALDVGALIDGPSTKWTGGTLTGKWTIVEGGVLTGQAGGTKLLNGNLVNDGTLGWNTYQGFQLSNGATFTNHGVHDFTLSSTVSGTGGSGNYVNEADGVLRVERANSISIGPHISFVNNGTLWADGGITFNNGATVFNSGTILRGGGGITIDSDAVFNGDFQSPAYSNEIIAGRVTGNGAQMTTGRLNFRGGVLTGDWTIGAGAELVGGDFAAKILDGAQLTNNGDIRWLTADPLLLTNGTHLTNNGQVYFHYDTSILSGDGTSVSLVNLGSIAKLYGDGELVIGADTGFRNEGDLEADAGTIVLPDGFGNEGVLSGGAAFRANGLINAGHIAPGSAADPTATLTLKSDYTQTGAGFFDADLTRSGVADLFDITGSANLNGTLALTCTLGCDLADGDLFVLLHAAGPLSGTFADVTTSGFLDGFRYDLLYDYNAGSVALRVLDAGAPAVPEPAEWAMLTLGFVTVGGVARRKRAMLAT